MIRQRLDLFDNAGFDRGRSRFVELLWMIVQETLVTSAFPGSFWRTALLRMFGATIGAGVVFKPRVRIKFPWRLTIGAHSWIGESVWIDNLAPVTIGAHSCISQGTYLCTGNHDWSRPEFSLRVATITIGSECWIGAFCLLAPGSVIEDGAVLAMGTRWSGVAEGGRVHGGQAGQDDSKPRNRRSD